MTTMTLPRFLPLPEAARELGLSEVELRRQVDTGKIAAVMVNGEIVVSEENLQLKKENLPEYKKYNRLKGVPIWISKAEKKYKIPNPTLSRWARKGIISIIGTEKNKVLLDEQDVAYCAEIYRQRGGQGKTLFNSDGTPYRSKASPLAG